MNFSSTTFEEREKETKALKGFLVLSLISSLGFHLVVLASGVGNYFARIPQTEAETIEITMIDPPQEEKVEELKPEKSPQKVEIQEKTEFVTSLPRNTKSEDIVKTESQVNLVQPPSKIELSRIPRQIIQPKQPTQKLVENSPKPVQPAKPVALSNTNSSSNLRNTLRGIRDSRSSQSIATSNTSGSGTPGNDTPVGGGGGTSVLTGSGTGSIGSGSGIGRGNGSGNGSGIGSGSGNTGNSSGSGERVAAGPTTPKLPTNTGNQDSNPRRNGEGRAACQECSVRYSERSRRRRAEGKVGVAVDTDSRGNVTNVRLVSSSGDRELDEEHLRQARNWKLKPSESGRQGVQINTEYAMQGSRRHQQVRRRQQEREERQRQRETAAASNNNEESRTSRRLRRTNTTEAASTRVRRSEGENSLANRLRRRRREVTADVRTSGEAPQRTSRRRRRDLTPSSQPSDSANRLRNALRRSRQSAPAAEPNLNVQP